MANGSFQTQRETLLAEYEAQGVRFCASTLPLHSTRSVFGNVVNADLVNGVAQLVIPPQVIRFFDYGVGDAISLGAAPNHQANENDTNLARAKSTNGSADVVIEGMGISVRGRRVQYSAVDAALMVPGLTDDVLAALTGLAPLCDPASLVVPAQLGSPATLEEAIGQFIIKHGSIELEFDRRRTEKLGTLASLPEAGGSSYLRSNGTPSPDSKWRIPEGYRWNRDGEPDSELVVYVKTWETLTCPISLCTIPGAPGTPKAPIRLYVDLCLKLSGLQVYVPGTN